MTLENLVKINKLKPHKTNRDEIAKLRAAAQRNLQDAYVAGISAATRFDVAYKSIMQCALLTLMANGYRPSTNEPGHHITVIQSLPLSLGLPAERVIVLDALRKKRNLNDYSGDGVSEEEADSCIRAAEALLHDVEEWLKDNHPGML